MRTRRLGAAQPDASETGITRGNFGTKLDARRKQPVLNAPSVRSVPRDRVWQRAQAPPGPREQ